MQISMHENDELKESISKASDERILEILSCKTEYLPEAVRYAEEEFSNRQLSPLTLQHKETDGIKLPSLKQINFTQREYSTKDHHIEITLSERYKAYLISFIFAWVIRLI